MNEGDWGLRLTLSELLVPKPGRPRMQYLPSNSDSGPMGLFEVDVELCEACVKGLINFGLLFEKMTAGIERKKLPW